MYCQMFKLHNHHQAEDSLRADSLGRAVLYAAVGTKCHKSADQKKKKKFETPTRKGQVRTVCRGGAGSSILSAALWFRLACLFV